MHQNTLCKSDNLPKLSILTSSLKSLSFSHRIQTLQPIYSTNIFPSNTQSPHKQPSKNFLNKNPSTLFTAIEFNNLIQTKNLLLNSNLEINTFNDEGITPLHIAVIKGNINMVNLLLINGADPNILSENLHQTPLHFAYMNQQNASEDIINLLKKFKADDEILDIHNKKPSDYNYMYVNNNNNNNVNNNNVNYDTINNIDNANNNNNVNYTANNTANTVTLITMNDHLDSFITTNRDENSKSNVNSNLNTIQTPQKNENNFNDDDNNNNNSDNNIDEINIIDSHNNYSNNIEDVKDEDIMEDSLEELDDNNLEYTKTFKDTNTKCYNVSDLPMINDDENNNNNNNFYFNNNNIIINKNLIEQNNLDKNVFDKMSHTMEDNIDDIYKKLIINKRNNIINSHRISYHNNSHSGVVNFNSNFTFNNNNNNNNYNNNINNNNNNNEKRNNTIININNVTTSLYNNSNSFNNNNNNINSQSNTNSPLINKNLNNSSLNNNTKFNNNFSNNLTCINNNNNNNNNMTYNSTQSNTGQRSNLVKKVIYDNNKNVSEFKFNDNINITKKTISDSADKTEENFNNLKEWLISINLLEYFNNFIENEIYDIQKLIILMKSYETKLTYEDIENLLYIKKPGHIYRILTKLEIDSNLIDSNITSFLSKKFKKENNNLKISISQEYSCSCFCKNNNNNNKREKNDLKNFLKKNGLFKFYQNFFHNGFDVIEFILLQMYSTFQINDEILENCFHIYEENDRKKVLKSLVNEMKKINLFVNSKEYVQNNFKDKIKYENVLLEDNKENNVNFNNNNNNFYYNYDDDDENKIHSKDCQNCSIF